MLPRKGKRNKRITERFNSMNNTEEKRAGMAWRWVMIMFGAALLLSLVVMTFGWVDDQIIIFFLLGLGALITVACGVFITSNKGEPPRRKKIGNWHLKQAK